MKKLLALLLYLTLLPLNVPPVLADDNDIFGANVQPNVLIFIDSSGSMDDYIDQASTAAYDPATTYAGTPSPPLPNKATAKVYRCQSGRTIDQCENDPSLYVVYKNTIAEVTSATARSALTSSGKWNGNIGGSSYQLRTGNYLNYHFSPVGGHEKKIVVAKRVLTNLINNTDDVRFGVAKFTGNSTMGPGGAQIIADVGATKATLTTAINGITPDGFTPLKGALEDMGKYYKGTYPGKTSPIQSVCQPNFIIMMSDGLHNGHGSFTAEATLRRTQDHASLLPGTQNVLVDTIGFAIPATDSDAANADLATAAQNGGGHFYSTTSETELENALDDAIRRITAATYAFATPVIPTTSVTGLTRAYMAAFQTDPSKPFWHGYLKAYNRGTDGNVPTDANGAPLDTALAWEAGQKLTEQAAADRTIYTLNGTTREAFAKSNSNLTQGVLDVTSSAARDKVIDFIRGVDVNDENGDGSFTDDRPWKLGDIYHSTPVVVTPPFQPSTDATYRTFRTAQASRETVVLAASNDGMLHAFRESDGVELWAFLPPDLLPKLKNLVATSGDHQFLLDSSPIVADVKTGGTWKTIVVFGERRGGARYYALDITDTTNPQYLWYFTDPEISETWSEPIVGKVKMNSTTGSTEKYVAIFGGGYDTATNNQHGRGVFVVDVADGSKLWQYKTTASAGAISTSSCAGSDDRACMNFSIPASPLALDLNNDGFIDKVYIGDVGGQMWKLNLEPAATLTGGTTGTVNNWQGKRFFRAGNDTNPPTAGEFSAQQAIYYAPDATFDSNTSGRKLWIFFGTGDRNHPLNITTMGGSTGNRFYGVKDDPYANMTNNSFIFESPAGRTTGMVNATSVNQDTDGNVIVPDVGWYYVLNGTESEKILARATVFNKVVYFTSFVPAGSAVCGGGGIPRLYAVRMESAYAAIDWSSDHAYAANELNNTNTRSTDVGAGIGSMPIITTSEDGAGTQLTAQVIVGGSGGVNAPVTLISNPAVPPDFMRRVLYWRERF